MVNVVPLRDRRIGSSAVACCAIALPKRVRAIVLANKILVFMEFRL